MRLIVILVLISFTASGQTKSDQLLTTKYAGTFRYAERKSSASATILIYPESDSTVLFYIDINREAPSYNMGALYGRIKISKGQGTYASKDHGCQWKIQFSNSKLMIATMSKFYACGFGNGVVVDGSYEQTSKKIPDYFVSLEGTKHFFKTTTPERFNIE